MASIEPLKIHEDLELSDPSPLNPEAYLKSSKLQSGEVEWQSNGTPNRVSASSQGFKPPSKEKEPTKQSVSKKVLFGIKAAIGFAFLITVLGFSVLSKLTLVSLTDQLRSVTNNRTESFELSLENRVAAVTIYWYIQFILLIPSFITFIRCIVVGVIGKTTNSFPWPSGKAILYGIFGSILEVLAMTVFVYVVLPQLSPGVGMLLLCGVFFFQIIIDMFNTPHQYWCQNNRCSCAGNGYDRLRTSRPQKLSIMERFVRFVQIIFENKAMKILALSLQIAGVIGFIAVWVVGMGSSGYDVIRPMVGGPLAILVLSLVWSTWFQKRVNEPNKKGLQRDVTARYKAGYINSGLRLFFYPFVSYVIFRYTSIHGIDPWCLDRNECYITLKSDHTSAIVVQVVITYFAYIIGWIACSMALSRLSLALPLLLSTPVAVTWYYLDEYLIKSGTFPHIGSGEATPFADVDKYAPLILSLLWLVELITMGYFLLVKTNIILSDDSEMFITPHYDGIFFEQYMILNRQTKKNAVYDGLDRESGRGETIHRHPRTIFVCSTMYRENETEMKQMLKSIYTLANHYSTQRNAARDNGTYDRYESHIFFDGAINGTQIQEFGLQLLSLLEEALHVNLERCKREKTPYGYRLTWDIGLGDMPFTVHFKDKNLVKPKKRWSQVMYMNYVLNHRMLTDNLDPNDTFILTTDADIEFTPQSVDALLDMFACNEKVAAVSARTHPQGSGPVYWYQIFDYAIGHWFQKPAEHILGCVLCSPGCFSVYRCQALRGVIETYSTEVLGANEFLMKDMGEDRWLCTLLIKAGWRLEYCAISEDKTYCPTDFGEFYKQRRRWIPSTIANIAQLITEATSITKKNDSVSILFIIFQAVMVFSTAISPATVILVISSGLQSAYDLSNTVTLLVIALLIVVSVFYGVVCIYGSPQTQIDMAKLLTFVFAIIMSVVVVGIFKEVVYDIVPDKAPQVLRPPNCTNFNTSDSDSEAYQNCIKAARYIEELAKSLHQPEFQVPVSAFVFYIGAFAITFFIAAILHLPEWYCLLHCVWYLLALPSGYLLLLIYSAANLDSQSWGTREGSSGKDKGLLGWLDHLKHWWRKCIACCLWCWRRELPSEEKKQAAAEKAEPDLLLIEERISPSTDDSPAPVEPTIHIDHQTLDEDTKLWLESLECDNYEANFEEHGYVNKHFIAAMKPQDFEAIGIDERGFRLRLQNAAKRLPSLPIYTEVPIDVEQWLIQLEIREYTELFHLQGYKTGDDIQNLKDLTDEDLRAIGISKRAHLQRLRVGIDNLVKPTALELRIRHTETQIDNLPVTVLESTDKNEADFWTTVIHRNLKPVSVQFQGQVEDLKKSLRNLRNAVLAVLFLINIMWIALLYTLDFPELLDYGIDSRGFQLLFLAVYGFIIIVQFITLIFHRIETLVHYLGRIQPDEVMQNPNESIVYVTTWEATSDRV